MIYFIDLFCGAGGMTSGIEAATINGDKCSEVLACLNHDEMAIASHLANHPHVKHFTEDVRTFDLTNLIDLVSKIRQRESHAIIAIHASLECTNFSKAKGGLPRDADSRTLAEHLYRYLEAINPDYLTIENVEEFLSWGPLDENGKPINRKNGIDFQNWVKHIKSYGYNYEQRLLNSADYGAYTSRKRLFIIFAKEGLPIAFPIATHAKKPQQEGMFGILKQWKPVREVLNLEDVGKSIFDRDKPLVEKSLARIYAGLIKFVAGGQEAFLFKYNSTNGKTGIHHPPSIEEPCPTVSTQDRIGVVQPQFIVKYFSGHPEHKQVSLDGPAGTIKTIDNHSLISTDFLMNYHGKYDDSRSLDRPAGTVTTKDREALIQPQFITRDFSNGGELSSVETPSGSIMSNPKLNLVSAEPFILNTNYNNIGSDIKEPCPTVLGSRHHYYLLNPQWGINSGNSVDKPSPVIIARQDKSPLFLVTTDEGFAAIEVYETDSEYTKKIKEFMALYGIIDIKMRMLRVPELLRIQGFPEGYVLKGTQTDQKKFIGNAVEVTMARVLVEAISGKLQDFDIMKWRLAA